MREDGRLGLRILKTGIAVTLCLLLGDLIHLQQPLVAVVAAVLSVERSMNNTLRAGTQRLCGAVIGILGGGLLYHISPQNAGLCGLGIVAAMYACKLFRWPGGTLMSTFCLAVMMFHPRPAGTIATAIDCGVASVLGIGLAFLINLVLFPPNYAPEILTHDKQALSLLHKAAVDCESRLNPPDFYAVTRAIEQLDQDICLYTQEWKPLRNADGSVFKIAQRVAQYREVLADLTAIDRLEKDLSPQTATVFSYHLNRAKKLLDSLEKAAPSEE